MNHQAGLSLDNINNLSVSEAQQWFSHCCAAPKWFEAMAKARPFTDIGQVKQVAQELWLQCTKQDLLTAFEAHPMAMSAVYERSTPLLKISPVMNNKVRLKPANKPYNH